VDQQDCGLVDAERAKLIRNFGFAELLWRNSGLTQVHAGSPSGLFKNARA
jgi:hypothetical protein